MNEWLENYNSNEPIDYGQKIKEHQLDTWGAPVEKVGLWFAEDCNATIVEQIKWGVVDPYPAQHVRFFFENFDVSIFFFQFRAKVKNELSGTSFEPAFYVAAKMLTPFSNYKNTVKEVTREYLSLINCLLGDNETIY